MVTVAKAPDRAAAVAVIQQKFGVVVDARSPTEVLADVRRRDPDAVPVITPANYLFVGQPDGRVTSAVAIDGQEVVPMAGPSQRTTILCNELGQWVQYRADRHGFNNPDAVWASMPVALAILGDSYAHGYCVPPEKSFAGRLRHVYPGTLNLGVAGHGPLLMLATLTEYLPRLQPPIVLWCYFEGNDLENLQVERNSALLNRYLQDGFSQPALTRQSELDHVILAWESSRRARAKARPRSAWHAAFNTVITVTKLTAVRGRAGLITPTEPFEIERVADFETANMRVFREVLRNAADRVQRWNGQLAFVYLPTWERYSGQSHTTGEAKREEVLAIARDLGIPIIDVETAFRATGDPLSQFPFRAPGHYTENGHRLVEETIVRDLQSRLSPIQGGR